MKDRPRTPCAGDRTWTMFALIVWACLTGSPHAQSVTTGPEQLAGPWEMATPARVDGIILNDLSIKCTT